MVDRVDEPDNDRDGRKRSSHPPILPDDGHAAARTSPESPLVGCLVRESGVPPATGGHGRVSASDCAGPPYLGAARENEAIAHDARARTAPQAAVGGAWLCRTRL